MSWQEPSQAFFVMPTSPTQQQLPIVGTVVMKDVLKRISEQGGFAYATLVSLAAAGNLKAAEAAHEMAWEQLHSAPWQSVHPVWRDAYSLSCLHMASFLHGEGKIEEALRVLDMGLMMGGPLLRLDLHTAISFLQPSASEVVAAERDGSCTSSKQQLCKEETSLDAPVKTGNSIDQTIICHGNFRCWGANEKIFRVSGGSTCIKHGRRVSASAKSEISMANARSDSLVEDVDNMPKVLMQLPKNSLSGTSIKKRSSPALEDFLLKFFLQSTPTIITDAMNCWPAMQKWKDMDYLQQAVGNRTVPVEVGDHYLASGWKQELMTISQVLERLKSPECSPNARVYLAQHPLFDQIPLLREDIFIPDYCAVGGGDLHSINSWLGPAGTITPLHHDPHHNLLAQVVGKKYVRLYSPCLSEGLYPYSEPMLSNSSQVDLDNPDYEKYPLAQSLPFMDCILEEGEMLYIPPKWWHYVRSLSASFSVSFWWNVTNSD